MTHARTSSDWFYFAPVMDFDSCGVVGWGTSTEQHGERNFAVLKSARKAPGHHHMSNRAL